MHRTVEDLYKEHLETRGCVYYRILHYIDYISRTSLNLPFKHVQINISGIYQYTVVYILFLGTRSRGAKDSGIGLGL